MGRGRRRRRRSARTSGSRVRRTPTAPSSRPSPMPPSPSCRPSPSSAPSRMTPRPPTTPVPGGAGGPSPAAQHPEAVLICSWRTRRERGAEGPARALECGAVWGRRGAHDPLPPRYAAAAAFGQGMRWPTAHTLSPLVPAPCTRPAAAAGELHRAAADLQCSRHAISNGTGDISRIAHAWAVPSPIWAVHFLVSTCPGRHYRHPMTRQPRSFGASSPGTRRRVPRRLAGRWAPWPRRSPPPSTGSATPGTPACGTGASLLGVGEMSCTGRWQGVNLCINAQIGRFKIPIHLHARANNLRDSIWAKGDAGSVPTGLPLGLPEPLRQSASFLLLAEWPFRFAAP